MIFSMINKEKTNVIESDISTLIRIERIQIEGKRNLTIN